MSETLPKGRRNIVVERRYDVFIQVSETVSTDSSLPISGRAIFTDEPKNAVRKELIIEINKIVFSIPPILY